MWPGDIQAISKIIQGKACPGRGHLMLIFSNTGEKQRGAYLADLSKIFSVRDDIQCLPSSISRGSPLIISAVLCNMSRDGITICFC